MIDPRRTPGTGSHKQTYGTNEALAMGALPEGYRYEIDSSIADVRVRVPDPQNPDEWHVVQPVLTVIQDAGSRALLTFDLALSPVDAGGVLKVLRRAIDPRLNFIGLPSPGFPHEVAVDHGVEYQGLFVTVMAALGVTVSRDMLNEPQVPARVERLIRTITQEVFASVDGLLTLPELEARILAWALVYNDRSHVGFRSDTCHLPDPISKLEHSTTHDNSEETS